MMLSSNPLERFMRSDYVTLAFRNVVGHEAEVKENVLEATEPVSSLAPVGAIFVVELANEEVYIHDLMLAYFSESSFILTMIVQNKHNTASVPLKDGGTLLKLTWRQKVEPSSAVFPALGTYLTRQHLSNGPDTDCFTLDLNTAFADLESLGLWRGGMSRSSH